MHSIGQENRGKQQSSLMTVDFQSNWLIATINVSTPCRHTFIILVVHSISKKRKCPTQYASI